MTLVSLTIEILVIINNKKKQNNQVAFQKHVLFGRLDREIHSKSKTTAVAVDVDLRGKIVVVLLGLVTCTNVMG